MTDAMLAPERKSARMGLLQRFGGVLTSPGVTFADVAEKPRWFGMLALVLAIAVVCTVGFLSTEVGQEALLDQQVRGIEAFGGQVNEQTYERLEGLLPYSPYLAGAQVLILGPLIAVVVAGILFAIFNAGLGGEASFRQVFAVLVHANVILAVQQIFVLPLDYVRESMSSPTNLAVFLPMLEESGFLAHMLGTIDLFLIWWVTMIAIGLAVLYRRKARPIALSLYAVYLVIAIVLAVIRSVAGGT